MARHSLLEAELDAVTETGLYESRESFLSDAVQTLFAARPDLREVVACRLYDKGVLSLGRAAEWTGLSIEDLKERLDRKGISRQAPETAEETEAMARAALRAVEMSQGRTGGRRAAWLRTEAVALVVGPALGGFLLFGSLLPSPWIGGVLGALVGIAAGMARNRELARHPD